MTYIQVQTLRKQAGYPTVYAVQKGDTFDALSRRHNVSLKRLQAANPSVDPRKIRIGSKLNIPIPDWQDIQQRKGFDPRSYTPLSPQVIKRIRFVQSSNGKNLYNPKTGATGPYQITPVALKQAQRLNKDLNVYRMDSMQSDFASRRVMDTLMRKWTHDFQHNNERLITPNELVRMWHAGPVNYNGTQAKQYETKVFSQDTGRNIR